MLDIDLCIFKQHRVWSDEDFDQNTFDHRKLIGDRLALCNGTWVTG